MIFSWNLDLWRLVWSAGDKLPPALLLAGPAGVGKSQFAEALAQAALCAARTASNEACGICHPCRLFLAGAHPDVRVLEASATEESGAGETAAAAAPPRIIGVERIRELRDFIEMSSHLGGRKVVLINPAERLHVSAANALLKTLEEPSQGTVFALVSVRPQQLLPTLRSRCFRVDFRVPSNADALSWLREEGIHEADAVLAHAGNAPLAAADLARSPFWKRRPDIARLLSSPHVKAPELARAIEPDDTPAFCGMLYKWCADLLCLRLAGRVRYNPDYAKPLGQLAVNLDVLKLQKLMKELTAALRYIEHPLNQRLVCERMSLGYARALSAQEQ